jgi:NAD(P)-dependent dehydrogenase (short-subunit alcohol dehydrogenase family)
MGRDASRCRSAAESIASRTGRSDVGVVVADLSTMDGVRIAARGVSALDGRIDVLVNNAGAIYERRAETVDAFEQTFALNVLAPFLLTHLLRAELQTAASARVVMVDSSAHRGVRLNFSDLQTRNGYRGFRTYSRSKLALLLLTYEFARRWQGSGVHVNAVHPGFVRTGFGRNNPGVLGLAIRVASVFALNAEQGADTPFYVSASPELGEANGLYFVRRRAVASSRASYDREAGRRLWTECERLVGIAPSPAG